MKNLLSIIRRDSHVFIVLTATILGGWTRLLAPAIAGFPINDGGLFLVLMDAIQKNGFALPKFVDFNGFTIPFTYPPFSFYTGAWISSAFHIDLLQIVRWLPATVLILTIPAFYWLAEGLLGTKLQSSIATLIYALTPRASSWAMMGGGVTRSFGLLFLLLALASIHRLFKLQDKRYLFPAVLFSALLIVTHPEATLHAIGISLLLVLIYGRNKAGIFHVFALALGVPLLTSIWWIPMLTRFGLDPYLNASQTGFNFLSALLIPLLFPQTTEPQLTLVAVLGLIGFAYSLTQKKYLLPVLYIIPYLIEPRSAPTNAVIFLSMLAGISVCEIIVPALSNINPGKGRTAQIVLLFLGIYLFQSAVYFDLQLAGTSVSAANRQAFTWLNENTPTESHILILTGESDLFCDGISEWLPTLTERVSPFTVQGREWLPGFDGVFNQQRELQACMDNSNPLNCLEEKAGMTNYDYIYIARQSTIKQQCRVISPVVRGDGLISALEADSSHRLVYRTDEVIIFSHQQP